MDEEEYVLAGFVHCNYCKVVVGGRDTKSPNGDHIFYGDLLDMRSCGNIPYNDFRIFLIRPCKYHFPILRYCNSANFCKGGKWSHIKFKKLL